MLPPLLLRLLQRLPHAALDALVNRCTAGGTEVVATDPASTTVELFQSPHPGVEKVGANQGLYE